MLVSLPVALRHALPATSRVLPQLHALEAMTKIREHLSGADQLKLDRLVATLADVALLTARIKHLDRKLPDLLEALGCTLTELCGVGVVTAIELHVEIGPDAVSQRSRIRPPVRLRSGRTFLRRRARPGTAQHVDTDSTEAGTGKSIPSCTPCTSRRHVAIRPLALSWRKGREQTLHLVPGLSHSRLGEARIRGGRVTRDKGPPIKAGAPASALCSLTRA